MGWEFINHVKPLESSKNTPKKKGRFLPSLPSADKKQADFWGLGQNQKKCKGFINRASIRVFVQEKQRNRRTVYRTARQCRFWGSVCSEMMRAKRRTTRTFLSWRESWKAIARNYYTGQPCLRSLVFYYDRFENSLDKIDWWRWIMKDGLCRHETLFRWRKRPPERSGKANLEP